MNVWNLIMLKLKAAYTAHIANASAHHIKYTNAEAVAALDAADKYVKNTGDDMTGNLNLKDAAFLYLHDSLNRLAYRVSFSANKVYFILQAYTAGGVAERWVIFRSYGDTIELYKGCLNMGNLCIKNPKNHVHSGLSGTKKLVEIDIGGVSYYFEVYPTKA